MQKLRTDFGREIPMYDQICENFITSRNAARKVFPLQNNAFYACSAAIFTAKGTVASEERLRECKEIIHQNASILSHFRGMTKVLVASMLADSQSPEELFEKGKRVYKMLKEEFFLGSSYFPVIAIQIAQTVPEAQLDSILKKTKDIYQEMKHNHPFLTGAEDGPLCACLACSERPQEELMADLNQCYELLKGQFFNKEAVQSLSHVLALCEGTPEEKCKKTMDLFNALKDRGYKYGTHYELPTLGVVAVNTDDPGKTADEMIEIAKWLSKQRGFGILGCSKRQRLMYAGIILNSNNRYSDEAQSATVSVTISIVIAEIIALVCAAEAASVAASSTNN